MSDIGFGLWMTAMGMGTVFLLLVALMCVLLVIGKLDGRGSPAPETGAGPSVAVGTPAAGKESGALSGEESLAIAVAVAAHSSGGRAALPAHPVRSQSPHVWLTVTRGHQHNHQPRKG